ncbi:MAG: GNAT family N-acetyltransferase [Acidimicrobiales bacterium]
MWRVVELEAEATHDLRRRVLRDHVPGADVVNPEDDQPGVVHLGVVDGEGRVAAVATVSPEPTARRPGRRAARLRSMAVHPDQQGQGLGTQLLAALVARARQDGYQVLWANGRDTALAFYRRHGWEVVGDGFESVGLPHHVVLVDL